MDGRDFALMVVGIAFAMTIPLAVLAKYNSEVDIEAAKAGLEQKQMPGTGRVIWIRPSGNINN